MQPVFIVAQYKSGTSWLLTALSAHPNVLGLLEVDIIRAAWQRDGRELRPADAGERVRGFFGTSAWCSTDVAALLEKGEKPEFREPQFNRPQSFEDLEPAIALELFRRVENAPTPVAALDAFLEATATPAAGASHLVLKAADQIAVFEALGDWRPDAPKLAITRDGRDAAISAVHYKRLMQNAPWYSGDADYETLLRNWATRARMIADRAREGSIHLVRYEDLSRNFAGVFAAVLEFLGLDADPGLVERINERTSFEARTGRERGSDGTGIIRKGMVGEWRVALSDAEKQSAWELAGSELTALGYTEDGEPADLPADLT